MDHDACNNSHSHEDHEVLPSDVLQGQRDGSTVGDGIGEETGKGDGGAFAAQMGRPDFGAVDVRRALDGGSEVGAEDEVQRDGGVDARLVGSA